VIGVSGGLDSTHALLVAATTMTRSDSRAKIFLPYTLPAFATTQRTKSNALALMRALGVSAREIDVTPACRQMLNDIDHPAARGEPIYDATFENVQAGARTSLLFRLANQNNGLVWHRRSVGIGARLVHLWRRRSDVALQRNASVPKTLIQHLIRWCARDARFGAETVSVLQDILATEISPELVPGDGAAAQRTEDFVGPYALQDFNLFYATRYGFAPSKIAFSRFTHGATRARAFGPSAVRTTSASPTVFPRSSIGLACSCAASSRPANSNEAPCQTVPR